MTHSLYRTVSPQIYTLWNYRREALEGVLGAGGEVAHKASAGELALTQVTAHELMWEHVFVCVWGGGGGGLMSLLSARRASLSPSPCSPAPTAPSGSPACTVYRLYRLSCASPLLQPLNPALCTTTHPCLHCTYRVAHFLPVLVNHHPCLYHHLSSHGTGA